MQLSWFGKIFLTPFILIVTVASLVSLVSYSMHRSALSDNVSPLVREIQYFEEQRNSNSEIDLTPVIEKHLNLGMTSHDAEVFFDDMGFQTYRSWKNKNTLVADYSSNVWPKWAHIVLTYRFVLHFEDEKLKSFEGKSYTDSP